MTAIKHLLHQIVDYAGLFPPAGLPLDQVVENYREYVGSETNWMLARLIVPASRLEEFATVYQKVIAGNAGGDPWQISALIPPVNAAEDGFAKAMQAIESFNAAHSYAVVDTVEGKLPSADLIDATCENLLPSLNAFLEVPWQDPNATLQALAKSGRDKTFAKIRTGGVTEDLIPASERVANFICQCVASGIGLKATAGLHHPLRDQYALTYDEDADRGTMHGFMNVFLAICFARVQLWTPNQVAHLLETGDPESFKVEQDQISFQDQSLTAAEIQSVRDSFAISFGSCSFVEPVQDLIQLGWLADAAKTV